jgi:DNA-binding NarL/FixJ family response regulator
MSTEHGEESMSGFAVGSRGDDNGSGSARSTLEPPERRVLELSAEGFSNSEVAELSGIPVGQVRARLLVIMEKLGAHSKLEALLIAIRHGLIRLPPR